MGEKKLLLIDDDIRLGQLLVEFMQKYGHELVHASHPNDGIKLIREMDPTLVILDIMMPDKDGLEVCREIRAFSDIPILFLSARGDTTDRIVGLELGGDDYLPKPFEPRELLARIESILRRTNKKDKSDTRLLIDKKLMEATLDGQKLELTSMEFLALAYLMDHREEIVSRDELINHLQGMEVDVYGRAIDILISRLRQKLGEDSKQPLFIKTIRGQGYRYIGEVV